MKEMDQTEYAYKNGYQKGYEEGVEETKNAFYEAGASDVLSDLRGILKAKLKKQPICDFEWGIKYGLAKVMIMIDELEAKYDGKGSDTGSGTEGSGSL